MDSFNKNDIPICLFTFNRLPETIETVEALRKNYLAKTHDLIFFSDGPRTTSEEFKVQEVRKYLRSVKGFRSIKIFEAKENKGLANSIIEGVSQVLRFNNSVIVLEDDLVTSPNFLDFMVQALAFYKEDENIISLSGFTMDLPSLPGKKDFYFGYRASSWGWATWSDRWESIDWTISDYEDFLSNKKERKRFKKGGSDLGRMLRNQMIGNIDSWAVRFCYNQFKKNQKTVFPTSSKVSSIGFGEDATHTSGATRFKTRLDTSNRRDFEFEKYFEMDKNLSKEFAKKFSFIEILKEKIKQIMKK